jgi:hypothetical protein
MRGNDTPGSEALKERILAALLDLAEQDPQEVLREALRAESGQGSPAADSEADGPTDDEFFAAFEQAQRGEAETPRPQADSGADEGPEPSDDEMFAAFERSWKGEDS